MKNVLVIGDSLSIGYTPYLNAALSAAGIALVQHAPWDVSDGGAEETAYGLSCLPTFLSSPSGLPLTGANAPDLVLFNWGMHDGPMGNETLPGQNGPQAYYLGQLSSIVGVLSNWAATSGARGGKGTALAFVTTTCYVCDATANGSVQALNAAATALMATAGIPVIDTYDPIASECGPLPAPGGCKGIAGCWCPHCPPMYGWLANTTLIPAVKGMLQQ